MRLFPNRTLPPGDPSKFVLWRYMDIVDPDGEPYLSRLYIFRTPWLGLMWHQIKAADFDRTQHSHPWGLTKKSSFWSYVVRGGYTEELATIWTEDCGSILHNHRTETHRAGRWHAFGLNDVHRITEVKPGTITLVVTGCKRSGWGFWVKDRIVPWREYLDSQGRSGNGAR